MCPKIPSSWRVDFCLNNSLRGVDSSDSSLCDDGDGDIVSAEESSGGRGTLVCALAVSLIRAVRATFAFYQNKDRWCNAQVVNR
jgi:hypothetical protein